MFTRECDSCGTAFETDNLNRRKCQKGCGKKSASINRARTVSRETNDIEFVGVDGEGVDRPDGAHEYVMLSVGDKTLWNDGHALELEAILRFLWNCYQEKPHAAYVGFFLGYDFIQWLKLLPEREARLLFTARGIVERTSQRATRKNPYPDAVVWEGWEVDIMAGRRFRLRPHVCHGSEWNSACRNRTCRKDTQAGWVPVDGPQVILDGEMEWEIPDGMGEEYEGDSQKFWIYHTRLMHDVGDKKKGKAFGWMYVCDTGPFWQTSFLNVINPKAWGEEPVCSDDEYQTVVAGKDERGNVYGRGETSYYEEMVRYNILENELLARVTTRLNQGFMNDRVPIKIPKTDWYGPGRAAQLWMDQLHRKMADPEAREHNRGLAKYERVNERGLLNADVYMSMPPWFYEAAQSSYYGGWFEQFMHGHVGDVWEYDINSAYPYIIASLPCLHTDGDHTGTYVRGVGDGFPRDAHSYTLVYGTFEGSDPYIGVLPFRNEAGLISRPQKVKGWYWWHEVEASITAGLCNMVEVQEWMAYHPCNCGTPFNPGDIGINTLYQLRLDFGKNTPQGKSAKLLYNSAYGKTAQSIGSPKYSNPVYASLITAGCRTLILEAIASHPLRSHAVAMVATDGIYFLEKHPSLHLDKTELGAWDESQKFNLTQLMPGVYWDDSTREAVKKGGSPKLKSRGVSARDLAKEIDKLDDQFAIAQTALRMGGEFHWPGITFRTGFLLDSCKSALARGKWNTAGNVTHGAERSISADPKTKRQSRPYVCEEWGVVRSRPFVMGEKLETTPYQKSFGYLEHVEGMNNVFGDRVSLDGDDGMQYWRDLINGTLVE